MATSACRPISNAAGSYLCQVTKARSAGECEPRGTAKSRRAGISSTRPCRARAEVRQSVARGERSRASTRSRSIRPSCGLRNRPWPTRSRLPAGERSRQRVQHCVQHRVQHRVRLRAWPRHGISLEFSGVLYPHALLWKDSLLSGSLAAPSPDRIPAAETGPADPSRTPVDTQAALAHIRGSPTVPARPAQEVRLRETPLEPTRVARSTAGHVDPLPSSKAISSRVNAS